MRIIFLLLLSLLTLPALAEPGPLDGLKQSLAKDKQALAPYTWKQTQTLSVDGAVKKTTIFSVTLDANGKPLKSVLSEQNAPGKDPHGPLRSRLKKRKVKELKDYMQEVGALVQSYAHPDAEKLEAAFKSGKASLDRSQGLKLTVKDYLKAGDSVVIVFDEKARKMKSVQVNSYLDDPDNGVQLDCAYAQLPDGTNHLAKSTLLGEEKSVEVVTENSDYVKR